MDMGILNDVFNDVRTFKTVKGGYNQADVLTKTEAYFLLIISAQNGEADRSVLLAELEKVQSMEIRREKTGFFGKNGFDSETVDAYMADMEKRLSELLK